MCAVEIILEGNVLRKKIVGRHIRGGGVKRAAIRSRAAIIHYHCFGSIAVCAAQADVGLVDGEHFAVGSGCHQHQGSVFRRRIKRALDGVKVARSIGRNIQGLIFWKNRPCHLRSGRKRWERNKARLAGQWRAGC